MERDRPFVVPGFGCSYWEERVSRGTGSDLELHFVRSDDNTRPLPHIFVSADNAVTVVSALEAGKGSLFDGQGNRFEITAQTWTPFIRSSQKSDSSSGFNLKRVNSNVFLLKMILIRFHDSTFGMLEKEFGISRAAFLSTVSSGQSLLKSFWIEEVLHRMIFERVLASRSESLSSRFCETELLKEVYYSALRLEHDGHAASQKRGNFREVSANSVLRASAHHSAPQLQKSLQVIEENLHYDLDNETIARKSAVSESTLLRIFRVHLGTTPMKHVWRRRLQEARLLLISGGYSVLEVAHHARYSSGPAFTKAFTSEFGEPPNALQGRKDDSEG